MFYEYILSFRLSFCLQNCGNRAPANQKHILQDRFSVPGNTVFHPVDHDSRRRFRIKPREKFLEGFVYGNTQLIFSALNRFTDYAYHVAVEKSL